MLQRYYHFPSPTQHLFKPMVQFTTEDKKAQTSHVRASKCCTLGKALYAIREFIGVLMQDIDNTNYKEIVTSHEAVMMLYGRVDAISSVELAVTLSKKVVAVLTAGDVEVVACLGDFASHVLES
ncbi:hypothetical protein DYB37_012392 [Aphanomyces astaci]|uniref:Uncharacterized protein n=1 Tax=Aphanomyces astaci TaxID=112090 RepID=A0A397FK14_APHAT|nr:hypothetical protein DYB26_010971 [Aphanomyces astaci]RHZ25806.1 hypothetical protein DYB31_009414 [Aphanomyces astaci]RHZ34677.1 hypothetical protein DYB37_012392 [Aphanomyces astaci]